MMPVEKKSKAKGRKKTATRILKLVLALIVILILLVLFLVPAFISSGQGRRIILGKINKSIDGRVDFADLSMGWFKGIKVSDIGFKDRVGQISAQVKQITTKPHYGSIITGNLSFGETSIDQPKVHINLQNQPSVEPAGTAQPASAKAGYIALAMDLAINDGNFKVTDSNTRTVEFSQINSRLNLRPPGRQTDFDISLAVVGQKAESSPIHAAGKIKPGKDKKGWTLKGTTGDLIVEVNDLDLESLGPIFEFAKIEVEAKGLVSADVKAVIKDGKFEDLNGTINAKNLNVTGPALKGDRLKTGLLDVAVKLKSQQQLINIEELQLDSDWLVAKAGGMVPTTFRSWSDFLTSESDYSLNADFELDVDEIFSQMPRTFAIKESAKITSGQLNGNITANRGRLTGQVNLNELAGTVEDKKLALSEPVIAKLQISADKNKINFDTLDISAAFAKINAHGPLEQLKCDGYVDLEKALSEFGQFADLGPYKIAGQISEQGILSIGKDKIAGAGSAQVKNLSITSTDDATAQEPMADMKFAFALDRQSKILTFDSFEANATLGQVNIEQAIIPIGEKPQVPMQLNISAKNIDLAKAKPFAVLFASLPQETQLAGIAESKISVSSDKKIYKITTDSTKIKALKLTSPGKKPFEANEASLSFKAEVNPEEKSVNIKELQLESPQIKIRKGEFNQSTDAGKTKLSGSAECEYDWSAVSALAAPYLPEGLTLQGKRKDAINFVGEYPTGQKDKLLSNLTANAKLGFERAEYMGLDFGPTDVDIQFQNGLLNIPPFITTVNEGQFNFAGQADFRQEPALFKTAKPMQIMKSIKLNDETTKNLLRYVNPIFADAANVSGIANFHCEQLVIPLSTAAKKQTEVIGTISMEQLNLQASDLLGQILKAIGTSASGADITIHPTKFALQDGFLRYDDMQMDIGDNPVNFKGVIGLDKSLDMTITLPYTFQGRTIGLGKKTSDKRITLPLKGTVDKPELDLARLFEGQLRKQLEDQLLKGLDDLFK